MLNLLFISDNPKVEYLKSVLQPVLTVLIDVVPDFDHGLKDVFEKRPTTVCVQDQISGVTGESVARHIQMLLGNSAPTFILLHSGSGKARAIKGLYEHLVDLDQSNEALAENIKSTLMSLLGDQWDKIYIPSKRIPASVRSSLAVPEESRVEADKLVDDFLSDLETSGLSMIHDQPPVTSDFNTASKKSTGPELFAAPAHTEILFGATESEHIQSNSDEMAELLLVEVKKAARDESSVAASSDGNTTPESVFNSMQTASAPIQHHQTSQAPRAAAASANTAAPVKPSQISQTSKPGTPATPSAAEFRISRNSSSAEDHIPGELLQAFEDNYRSKSQNVRLAVIIALVCTLCAAGGWYLVTQKPLLVSSLKQRFFTSSGVKNLPPAVPVATPAKNPVPASPPQLLVVQPLPAFIPKEGRDIAYAVKNPGWERYVGPLTEFRLFSASGRIQAVQVLSVKEAPVPESLITSVLQGYAGSAEYRITSRNTKAGVLVESGSIRNKGEVIIYRKNGAVKAFVVSVN